MTQTQTQIEPTTYTLDVPGATIAYDVRPNESSNDLPLMIIGSPMGAAGFVTLASHFADRTVVTYDPRGSERSEKAEPTSESTPEQHADDIHRVIQAVGGPVDLFASSGGAVNALALVARYPKDVRTLVAHEPPTASLLPDREAAFAANEEIRDTYQQSGRGPALAKFIALVSYQGEVPKDFFASHPVDPQMFGLPTEDDGSRNDPLVGHNIITCTHYEPDFDALGKASTNIVLAIGATSAGTLAHRGGVAVADRLGQEPVTFPGGHDGFLGGEYGGMGEPDAFAAKLREVLAANA
jgi:pimeloyl-ACP methyl ester carboxylesterase